MNRLTRRDFLKLTGIGMTGAAAALALAGCAGDDAGTTDGGTTNEAATGEVTADSSAHTLADISDLSEDDIKALIDSHTDADGNTFVTASITDDPGSMNPYGSGSSKPRMVVMEGIFEGLYCIQGTGGELKPVLADGDYQVSDDGLTYTIKLKDYVHDQNGNAFTADDVYFTLETVARTEYSNKNMNYVDKVEVLGDYEIAITFNTPALNRVISTLIAYLFTQKSYEASADGMITTPVGTGPYAMTDWVSGSTLDYLYTKDYWETDESKIVRNSYHNVDRIIYKVIKDAAQRVIGLESGELDMSTGVSATDLGNFEGNGDYNIFSSLQDQVVSIFFNSSENSPCQDIKVRQAIAYAIDAQGVIDGVDQGNGKMCKAGWCDIFPDFDPKWNEEDYYDYNIEKAKELLAEAGVSNLKIKIMFENNDRLASVAQVVQGYLAEVGIELEIFPCDGALFNTYKLDNTQSDLLMATCGSSTFGSSSFVGNLRASGPDKSLIGITDEELVKKIDDMTVNAYTDWSYAHDLHYYVKDNCYLYVLYAPINFTVTSRVVTGFILNQKGMDSPNCCTYLWNK